MQSQNLDTSQGELIALEKHYWAALKNGDVTTALKLTGFPCVVTGPQGAATVDQLTYEKMMRESPYTIDEYELSDLRVTFHGRDVAVVSYALKQQLTVEGDPLTLECVDASTWVRLDGQWKCVQHSEAIRGDPFGRDRQQQPVLH